MTDFDDMLDDMRKNLRDSMGIPSDFFKDSLKEDIKHPSDTVDNGSWSASTVVDPDFNWYTENKNGLDPDMEVSIIYQCERCHSNPPELFKIFGKGIQDSIMLCKYCEKAFNTFIQRERGIMGFMRSGYRVEKINNRS